MVNIFLIKGINGSRNGIGYKKLRKRKNDEDVKSELSDEIIFDDKMDIEINLETYEVDNNSLMNRPGNINLNDNNVQQKIKENISLITDNIYKTSATKKTLILIPDSLEDIEDERNYYNSLSSKSINTKCPIIILTGNFEI